jgi:hypothetical protein
LLKEDSKSVRIATGKGKPREEGLMSYFLRRRIITSTPRPIATPASIDSTGKPGTAGITRGVVVELVLDSVMVTVSAGVVLVVSLDTPVSDVVCSVLLVIVASTVLVEVAVSVAVLLVTELVVDVD